MAAKSTEIGFWPTAIGGFIVALLALLVVVFLARRTGDDEPSANQPAVEQPAQP